MGRTLVIGDIHGGFAALKQVLELTRLAADDKLIFLGDYVDGWSESAQVIDYLIDFETRHSCVFLLGNHDLRCMEWLDTGFVNEQWLTYGGAATIKSYAPISTSARQIHLEFFKQMPYYHVDEFNRLFIHAGFSSLAGPSKEPFSTNYSWDRSLWQKAMSMENHLLEGSQQYSKRMQLFSEIYIGHTPTTNYKQQTPMKRANVWNIDTGAGFTGKLTVIDADSKFFWQSDALPDLYPDEAGRNLFAKNEKSHLLKKL